MQCLDRSFCRSIRSEDDHREALSDASGLRQDHLARNPSLTLVTDDECEVCLVFQDAQTLFGCCSSKDGGLSIGEGLFKQRFGVGIGRDEQQDRRMHGIQASPRTIKYWK